MAIAVAPTKESDDAEESSDEFISMDYTYSLITDVTNLATQQGLARPSRGNPAILEIPSALLTNMSSDTGGGEEVHSPVSENTPIIRVGNILSLLPVSAGGGLVESSLMTMSTTAYMAMQDFNNRHSPFWRDDDDDVNLNSQLELLKGCDFYMSMSFRDNEMSAMMTGRRWMEEFFPPRSQQTLEQERKRAQQIQSYAVLGTIRSATSTTAALLGAFTAPINYTYSSSTSSSSSSSDATTGTADYGIPTISASATSSALDKYPYFGRTVPTNKGEAEAFCFFLQSIGVHHFSIIHINDNFGTAYMASLVEAATSQQYEMQVSIVSYRDNDEQSLQSAIEQLKADNARFMFAIFSAGFWRESVLALYDAELMGEDHEWFFAESLATAGGTVLDMTNERELDLAKAVNRTAGISLRDYDVEVRILGNLMNQFATSDAAVDHYLALQRSGFLSLQEAQRHNESDIGMQNQDAFRQFLTTAAFPNPSTYALFTYDAIWALGFATCQANRSQTMGPQIFESFKELQFIGASGNVTFDPKTGTRDASGMNYQIVNLMTIPVQETSATSAVKITEVLSTVINLGQGTATVDGPLMFADGTTVIPSALQPVDEELNLAPNSVRAVCWSLSGLVMLCSVFFMVWTYQHRNFSRVRASQPIFLTVLCGGAFFMGLSIIFLTFQEPIPKSVLDAACMAEVWLLSLGFSTTFAALFAKTYRIHQVYQHARSCRRVQIKAKDVLWPFAIVFTLNFIILTAWTIVDPLEWHRVPLEMNQFGKVEESRGTCMAFGHHSEDTSTPNTPAFFWCLIAVDACAFLVSTIESYRARDLPSEFNETFYVWITNLIILECLFISIPVLFLVDEDPSAHMLSRSLIATVFALAVLIPTFLPKMPGVGGTRDGDGRSGSTTASGRRQVSSIRFRSSDTVTREPSSRFKNLVAVQKISQYAVDVVRGKPPTTE